MGKISVRRLWQRARGSDNIGSTTVTELDCPAIERVRTVLCQYTRKSLQTMYKDADLDKDGLLDQIELFKYIKANFCPEINCNAMLEVFADIDTDGDHEVL